MAKLLPWKKKKKNIKKNERQTHLKSIRKIRHYGLKDKFLPSYNNYELEGPKTNNKVTLALLFIVSVVLTVYTASAHYVASFVYEIHGHLFWPNTLGGSFTPWPYLPSGIAGQMLTLLNEIDTQYYIYVIRSGVLIYVTIASWVIVFWQFWKTRKSFKGMKNKS